MKLWLVTARRILWKHTNALRRKNGKMKKYIPDISVKRRSKVVIYNRQPISKYIIPSPTIINNRKPTIITQFVNTPVKIINEHKFHLDLIEKDLVATTLGAKITLDPGRFKVKCC